MLDKFSELIRGNLTKLQRSKLVALVTIEVRAVVHTYTSCITDIVCMQVHSRDIIEKLLKAGIGSPNAFEWMSQLRLYWVRLNQVSNN